MLSFSLRMSLLTHSVNSIAQMKESKEETRWPWLNQKSQSFSISAEVGSPSLDLTFVMDFWCEPNSLLNMYKIILNQCNGNPVTTAIPKHFQGNNFTHNTKPWTPNLRVDLPVCVAKSHFKPNSNLNNIFFTHPVFSGILCWFPLQLQQRMNQDILTLRAPSNPTLWHQQQEKGLRSKDLK